MYNPFGYCDCDGQVFMHDSCHEGFICMSDPAEPDSNGCKRTCSEPNQILVPNFSAGTLDCVDDTDR